MQASSATLRGRVSTPPVYPVWLKIVVLTVLSTGSRDGVAVALVVSLATPVVCRCDFS